MAKRPVLQVHLAYDADAGVWYVAKSDIPGLSLEAESPPELLRRVVECAPELLDLNAKLMTEAMTGGWSVQPIFDSPLELAAVG